MDLTIRNSHQDFTSILGRRGPEKKGGGGLKKEKVDYAPMLKRFLEAHEKELNTWEVHKS